MRRFLIVGTTTDSNGYRWPDYNGAFVVVAEINNRHLIKVEVGGAAKTTNTVADITAANGVQTDVEALALSNAQRTAIKTFLANQGLDGSWVDGTITDRRVLLFGLLRRVYSRQDVDLQTLLYGYDAE